MRMEARLCGQLMSFPPKVKAAALAACGRHCCICHRFCGTKIECHHIVQEAEGGPDTLENCIPVCFDCHSDMRSYDFRHPKGTKYSSEELRLHRDSWYEKVAAGGGLRPLPEHTAVDKGVFQIFQKMVPYFPALDYLKGRNFAGFSFDRRPLEPLFEYAYYADRPEYEFLDPELETARSEFAASLRSFTDAIGQHTFTTDLPHRQSVPEEWEITQPERFKKAVQEIHDAADAIEGAYAELIRSARRRLGVAGHMEPPGDHEPTS
jgi:hypothetical protein